MIKLKFLIAFIFILNFVSAQVNCNDLNAEFSGFCYEFHPNDTVSYIKEFKDGKAVGVWMQFDAKGRLIKQLNTNAKKDSLSQIYPIHLVKHFDQIPPDIEGVAIVPFDPYKDSIERANEIVEFVEEPAAFIGGTDSLMKFLKNNLRYPDYAKEAGLEGRVYVKFVVEKDGTISLAKVMRGIKDCPMCDKEAMRVVKAMPKWIPARHKGEIVRSYMLVPVKFKLD
ncbi:MAG: TonB family protein [Flavobacteriia bacterium]|jgi:TonB family protein